MSKTYNIRVYGILINDRKEVLVSDEFRMGMNMTKFPGGGLEVGEGIADCLLREWKEELNLSIEIVQHFYTTDFFIQSAFNDAQLISIYYKVKTAEAANIPTSIKAFDFEQTDGAQTFRWLKLENIQESDFTFPIDKKVALLLKAAQ